MRNTIGRILTAHGIAVELRQGRLFALSVQTRDGQTCSEWIDTTDWGPREVLAFLGY